MNPNLPILAVRTLDAAAQFALLPQRLGAWVSAALGCVGLLLAAMGIYGITSYTVSQRVREMAIRAALGASRTGIAAIVLRHGAALIAIGCTVGLLAVAAIGSVLGRVFPGFPRLDALPLVASVLFAVTGLTACLVPARRAVATDPAAALRYE